MFMPGTVFTEKSVRVVAGPSPSWVRDETVAGVRCVVSGSLNPATQGRPLQMPARVLLVIDQPTLAEVAKFALNHGVFVSQVASDAVAATEVLQNWHPHLALIDMDIYQGHMMEQLGNLTAPVERPPVIALTRRGDLKATLAAFE